MIMGLVQNKCDKALVSYSEALQNSLGKNVYADNIDSNY